jgi:hypothetical protein
MKLSLMSSIEIYWEESLFYIMVYAIYAMIVCALFLYVEYRLLESSSMLNKLIISNTCVFLFAIVLTIFVSFINGWLPNLFGGEIITFFVTVSISLVLIYVLKMFFINYFELQFVSPRKVSSLTSLFLFLPYIAFTLFAYVLASAFKN